MAKPTNAVKGFIRLTPHNSKQFLVNVNTIVTVRSMGEGSYVYLLHSPFVSGGGIQDLNVIETYEEVIKRISESS